MSSNLFNSISDARTLQSIELTNALAEIEAGTRTRFTQEQRENLMNIVMQEHSDTATEHTGNLVGSQESLNNLMYYYSRNNDVNNIQNGILDRATSEAQGSVRDTHLSKRQFEINEWTASNKAETLFMMQLLLMAVTFTVFMLFLNRIDIIPTSVFTLISSLVFIAFICTFIIRYQYTNNLRDGRYWNRKDYGNMNDIDLPPTCPGVENSSSSLTDLLSGGVSKLELLYGIGGGLASNIAAAAAAADRGLRA
jgi:hypothetical protein